MSLKKCIHQSFLYLFINQGKWKEYQLKACKQIYLLEMFIQSQQPRCHRRRYADSSLLSLQVRIPLELLKALSFKCCALSGRGLCDGLITHPEDSYRVCVCVCVCVLLRVCTCNCQPTTSTMSGQKRSDYEKKKKKKEKCLYIHLVSLLQFSETILEYL